MLLLLDSMSSNVNEAASKSDVILPYEQTGYSEDKGTPLLKSRLSQYC